LENAEQLGLKLHWHVPNFIEEESAAIRQCKTADVRINGARKGSAFMSEELAFEKAGGMAASSPSRDFGFGGAELVNRSRDDFLASAGLSVIKTVVLVPETASTWLRTERRLPRRPTIVSRNGFPRAPVSARFADPDDREEYLSERFPDTE